MPELSQALGFMNVLGPVFTKPAFSICIRLVAGWILCPARRAITGIYPFADPERGKCVQVYHHFFRAAARLQSELFACRARCIVSHLAADQKTLLLAIDDTTHKKTGRKVNGARVCRDAVRSTKSRTVFCRAPRYVPLCLVYPSPRQSGKRGRPRLKGARLPKPKELAPAREWRLVQTCERENIRHRPVHARQVRFFGLKILDGDDAPTDLVAVFDKSGSGIEFGGTMLLFVAIVGFCWFHYAFFCSDLVVWFNEWLQPLPQSVVDSGAATITGEHWDNGIIIRFSNGVEATADAWRHGAPIAAVFLAAFAALFLFHAFKWLVVLLLVAGLVKKFFPADASGNWPGFGLQRFYEIMDAEDNVLRVHKALATALALGLAYAVAAVLTAYCLEPLFAAGSFPNSIARRIDALWKQPLITLFDWGVWLAFSWRLALRCAGLRRRGYGSMTF